MSPNKDRTVEILGTIYFIKFVPADTRPKDYIKRGIGGVMEQDKKLITIYIEDDQPQASINRVVRHETLHAYLLESGLDQATKKEYPWAMNEEMIDWFALQGPKIFDTWKELNILS